MNRHHGQLAILMASTLLLSGCAAMAPGMSMPQTSVPTTQKPSPSASAPSEPSSAARMICGDETRTNVTRALALAEEPHVVDSWANRLYSCTYHLDSGHSNGGELALSVKESTNVASARSYFLGLRQKLSPTTTINGLANLGFPAYKTADGVVVFIKDNMTLKVDATQLPTELGPHRVSRSDFAYEIATAILGCWKG